MIPSEKCKQSISKSDGVVLELLLEVVPLLEFMRVAGLDRTNLVKATRSLIVELRKNPDYDPTLATTYRSLINSELGEYEDAASTFVNWLEYEDIGLPGWDNATCTMDFLFFARFCNGAAYAWLKPQPPMNSPESLSQYLTGYMSLVKEKGEVALAQEFMKECISEVPEYMKDICEQQRACMSDPFYAELQGEFGKQEEKFSMLPWVAAATLAALGIGWAATRKGR